jgi:hypothetical protein
MSEGLWPVEVQLAAVDRKDQRLRLSADEATRKKIARLLDLKSLGRFDAFVTLSSWLDGAVVRGEWSAEAEQVCGITLEPLPVSFNETFEIRVLPPGSPNAPANDSPESLVDPEAEDPPDVLESDMVPVGDYLIEQLSLNLDPFPRKADAVFTPPEEGRITPFAALSKLKVQKGDGED